MRHKCRICLRSKPRKSIAQLNIIENGQKQAYKDVIVFCLGIQIRDEPKETTKLCVKCYRKVIEFYHFKVLAIKNDEVIRSSLTKPSTAHDGVFLLDDVKIERETEDSEDIDMLEEPLVPVKSEDSCSDADYYTSNQVKCELKEENQSDDEVLSVIKHLKSQSAGEVTANDSTEIEQCDIKKKKNKGIIPGICEECGKEYKDIRLHMKRHLPKEQRPQIKCEHCDKVFFSNINKRKHIYRRHLAVKQKCHLCDKMVLDVKAHIQAIHNKEDLPFECVHCKSKFLTRARLKTHLIVHTKDRPFECDICTSAFRTKLSLTNHTRQVHDRERTHLCQFCSKSFFKRHHLHVHLRSHTNEKPFECPECGKCLQTSTSLKIHRLRHNNEKNVCCTMCDATFISKSALSNHMVSHLREKRYPCRYCPAKFHRSDHRKRHEFTAHLKYN